MNWFVCTTICATLLLGSVPANAIGFGWLSKGGKAAAPARAAAGAGGSAADVAARVAKAQVVAAAAGLGAGVIYVDAQGGRVLMRLAEAASEEVQGGVDDLADLSAHLRHQAAGVATRSKFILTPEAAEELGPKVAKLSMQGEVFIAEPFLGALKVTSQTVGTGTGWFKQVREGVLVPMQTPIGRETAETLNESLRTESIRVSALFDASDVDSLRKLANAAGDRLLDAKALMGASLANTLSEIRGGVMVVVGHVEDAAFVVRNARGEIAFQVPFQELEAAAAAADVRIISAGCASFCSGAKVGFTAAVTDTQMAEAITAMFNAKDIAGMLAAFGRSRPLILDASSLEAFSESRLLRLNQLDEHGKAVSTGATGIRVYAAARKAAESSSEFLSRLGGYYTIGLLLAMLMYRTGSGAFLRQFPRLPSPDLPGGKALYVLAWSARAALYLALAPFITLITVGIILLGGWKERENLQAGLWYCVRHPLDGTLRGLLAFGSVLLVFALYLGALSIAITCVFTLIAFLLPDYTLTLFWPGLIVYLGGSAVVVWMFLRFHRRVQAWQA